MAHLLGFFMSQTQHAPTFLGEALHFVIHIRVNFFKDPPNVGAKLPGIAISPASAATR